MPTILKTKNSVTTTVAPTTLQQGELAVNITDKKMWVGNAATTPVQILGAGTTGTAAGSNTQVQYNSSGTLAGDADFTFNGTTVTMANDASISGLTVGKGAGSVATNVVVGGNGSLGGGSQTGTNNTALGDRTLTANTSGSYNTAVGQGTVYLNTTGSNNSGLGSGALQSNTTGNSNTAIGDTAIYTNTTGGLNVAVGRQSLYSNTTASNNTAVGTQAAYSNTTGTDNVALGFQAFKFNTTGTNNTALGDNALQANTTASNNTAVGYQAGYSCTVSPQNTFIGVRAGYNANPTAGGNGYNTCVGYRAGYNLTTGYGNTFIGTNNGTGLGSGDLITTGNNHSILGAYNGNAFNLDITTATVIRYSVISCGNGNRHLTSASGYSTALGDNAVPQAGTGITFPATQNASANANTLDDYEEGTWTPTITGSVSNPTLTYDAQVGFYTKIGNVVNALIYIQTSARTGGSGSLQITGLPFAQSSTANRFGGNSLLYAVNAGLATSSLMPNGASGNIIFTLLTSKNDGSNWTDVPVTGIPNSLAAIKVQITYLTDY